MVRVRPLPVGGDPDAAMKELQDKLKQYMASY